MTADRAETDEVGTSIEPEKTQPLSSLYVPVHVQYSHWLEVSGFTDECLPISTGDRGRYLQYPHSLTPAITVVYSGSRIPQEAFYRVRTRYLSAVFEVMEK